MTGGGDSPGAIGAALAKLYARIPLGMRLGLEAMQAACAAEDHPERAFRAVHVAGTNGKGSVSAMVEAIARASGLRTGLYTSPHLCRFAERIRIGGDPIDDDALAGHLHQVLDRHPDLSFFEAATLTALLAFRAARVDLAVVEVGIGGRLDATNVLPTPAAAAITRIALDHVDRLGPTLADIAREKAGIAKRGLDIALGPIPADLRAVIDAAAHEHGATTSTTDAVVVPGPVALAGAHQRDNARVACVLGARIGATADAIAAGLAGVRWPARLEHIGPYLLDAAHNPDGAEALAAYVRSLGRPPENIALVFGTLADKDWPAMLRILAPLANTRVYASPQGSARMGAAGHAMTNVAPGVVAASVADALAMASPSASAPPPGGDRLVVVCGSLVLVGEARARILDLPRDPPVAL